MDFYTAEVFLFQRALALRGELVPHLTYKSVHLLEIFKMLSDESANRCQIMDTCKTVVINKYWRKKALWTMQKNTNEYLICFLIEFSA